ncbi:MAG TPA: phosphotransferase [Gemmataceae bacterium]|nr:phosphotransferase [Gemmataceae bacterium]
MASARSDLMAREVLAHYPAAAGFTGLIALGNRGGFSGARLWRVTAAGGDLCLRAWPADGPSPASLCTIHRLMKAARDAGLTFVPDVLPTRAGATWVEHADRLWEVTTWMPGRADFHDHPALVRLENVCTVLARLHRAWSSTAPRPGPCPGVQRRLARAREWTDLLRAGWQPRLMAATGDPVLPWAERAWHLLRLRIQDVPRRLAPWTTRTVPLQPCLCDVWHDHILFDGQHVSGLVDFGGVKMDHVAVDLARLLGSLCPDDGEQWAAGLSAYRRLRPFSVDEEALTAALDETGTLLGMANWLRWLYRENRVFEERNVVAQRLAQLVQRIESWQSPAGGSSTLLFPKNTP